MHAHHYVKGRTILVGDAAHTVNPLAGQGVNLGFGDVKAIYDILKNKGTDALSYQYGVKHRQKNRVMMTALEAIYHTFSNDKLPLQWIRNAGLFAAQNSGPAKKEVIRFAAGL
jgi:2-octaprenyl-3-methyl-6-methoxy-1,4-benzoquinol hydroxylase